MAIPATLGLASLMPAQDVAKDVVIDAPRAGVAVGGTMMGVAGQASTFQFIAAEPGMMGKTVTGAPYAAEGFTETVRMLADGTRITNKSSKKVWRDGQGRTREEGTLPMLGPWAAEGEAPKFITIYDTVAKVTYTLNEKDKTAFKHTGGGGMMAMKMMAEAKTGEKGNVAFQTRERHEVSYSSGPAVPAQRLDVTMAAPVGATFTRAMPFGADGGKEESLGTQIMEGLKVEGKRQTFTIKAGEIGNDRELVSVTERWTSPELQVLVRTTTKDPQMGETTYRLSNISRSEPAASLFQVPADYTVTDANERFRVFERKIEPK
jgi:hypothetical protein